MPKLSDYSPEDAALLVAADVLEERGMLKLATKLRIVANNQHGDEEKLFHGCEWLSRDGSPKQHFVGKNRFVSGWYGSFCGLAYGAREKWQPDPSKVKCASCVKSVESEIKKLGLRG